MTQPIVLTEKQRADLLTTLGHFAPPVSRVDVYGSRARGDAHAGSDIDLIVAGDVDDATVSRIAAALRDSYLSIFADVTAYSLLTPGDFADEVARQAKPLFGPADLAAAPPYRPMEGLLPWYALSSAPSTDGVSGH